MNQSVLQACLRIAALVAGNPVATQTVDELQASLDRLKAEITRTVEAACTCRAFRDTLRFGD